MNFRVGYIGRRRIMKRPQLIFFIVYTKTTFRHSAMALKNVSNFS